MIIRKLCDIGLMTFLGIGITLGAQNPIAIDQGKVDELLAYGELAFSHRPKNPIKRTIRKLKSDNDPSLINTWIKESYDGLTVVYLQNDPTSEPILSQLVVSKAQIQLPLSIHLGEPKSSVQEKVGARGRSSRNQLTYTNRGDGYPNTVSFKFFSGRLMKVEWDFIID